MLGYSFSIATDKKIAPLVSEISAIGLVSEKLMKIQQELAIGVNAVFEGHDMGTTVFKILEY